MLVFGSRGSDLALTQSTAVAKAVAAATGEDFRIEIITTRGDRILHKPLPEIGGKGLFTAELEDALREGRIDVAVHSLKDLPVEPPAGLLLGAIPKRADCGDVLVYDPRHEDPEGGSIPLGDHLVVGTSSPRRAAAVKALRPDLELRDLRGNVPTRVDKVRRGDYAGVVLAAAGLDRLGLDLGGLKRVGLPPERFVNAPGQGALGVQCRSGDTRTRELLATIHDATTARCVEIERAVLLGLGGGCSMPLGVHVERTPDGRFALRAALYSQSGTPAHGAFHEAIGDGADALVADAVEALRALVGEPLQHRTIVLVRPGGGDSRLAAPLAVAGARVETVAVTEVLPVHVTEREVADALAGGAALAFTSARAVDRLAEEASYAGIPLSDRRVFAVGPATAAAARARDLEPAALDDAASGGAALAALIGESGLPTSTPICLPCATDRHPAFEQDAQALGYTVRALPLYRVEPLAGVGWPVDRCDALVVTSPSSARAMAELGVPEHRVLVAIGSTTGAALDDLDLAHVTARTPTPGGVLEALLAHLSAGPDER